MFYTQSQSFYSDSKSCVYAGCLQTLVDSVSTMWNSGQITNSATPKISQTYIPFYKLKRITYTSGSQELGPLFIDQMGSR